MSGLIIQILCWCTLVILVLLAWALSSLLFLFVFCLPFLIDEFIYRFRYKRLDDFCENLVKIVKEDGAHKIAGGRDPVLAKVYQENHTYVQVIIGLASFYLLILLKKRGSRVARHFALTFMDISDEFQGAHVGMFEIAREALNGIELNTEVDMSCLYRNVYDAWCSSYKSLPGLGLLTGFEYTEYFKLVTDTLDISVVRYSEPLRFTKEDKDFICDGIVSWRFVSGNEIWPRYMAFARRVSRVFFLRED